jgi:hypothetical protein
MTNSEIAAMIIAATSLINTFALLPWSIIRSCQAYNLAKKIDKRNTVVDSGRGK